MKKFTLFLLTMMVSVLSSFAQLAGGDYVIKNVECGKYLNGSNNWGTKASVTEHAQFMTVNANEGKYSIGSHYSNGGGKEFLAAGENTFVDAAETFHEIEAVEGGYTIKDVNGMYLVSDGTFANFNGAEPQVWQFISKEEYIAEAVELAKAGTPADLTALVPDANFSRNNTDFNLWVGESKMTKGGPNNAMEATAAGMNAEKWGGNSTSIDFHTTVAGLPNGKYTLKYQGFYRYNNTTENVNDVAAAAHADGTEKIIVNFSANETTAPFMSIADEASVELYGKMPFSQAEASEAFTKGAYQNNLLVDVTDGTLTLKVQKLEADHEGTDWTILDNIELYLTEVEAPVAPVVAIEEGEGTYTVTSTSADAALIYLCKPYSWLEERETPYSALESQIEGMASMIDSEETWEMYDHMGLMPAPKTFNIADYEEMYAGQDMFIIAANIGWDGEKLAVLSNIALQPFEVPGGNETPEVEITVDGKEIAVAFAVGTDLGDNYSVKPYILNGEEKIEVADYVIDNTTGGFFDPLNLIKITLNEELAAGEYTLVLPADMFIVNGGKNNKEWIYTFTVAGTTEEETDTIVVDFTKFVDVDATGADPIVDGMFSFVGNNSKVTLTEKGFYTGGNSGAEARHIIVKPEFDGTLTAEASASGDNTDRYIFVATAAGADETAENVLAATALPEKGVRHTVSADLKAGETYYVCLHGNGTITALSYVYVKTASDPEIEVDLSLFDGEEEITINNHSAVSVEKAEAIKINVMNAPQLASVSYAINEMTYNEGEEGGNWTVGSEIVAGEASLNGIAYAEFESPIYFAQGKKYQITVTLFDHEGKMGDPYTYEINGSYEAVAEQSEMMKYVLAGNLFSIQSEGKNLNFNNQDVTWTDEASNFQFKLEAPQSIEGEDYTDKYVLRIYENGQPRDFWGSQSHYLNFQPAGGSIIFGLWNNDQNGTDVKNGAVFTIEDVEGGIAFKNLARGLYLSANGMSETPAAIIIPEASTEDGIATVTVAKNLNAKFFENGKLVIVKAGKKFNAAGQVIK